MTRPTPSPAGEGGVSGSAFHGPTALLSGLHGTQNNFYTVPRTPVSWPHQVGVLPRQADCFQHRAAVEALEEATTGGGTAILCQVLAGTGGVGKTQLAANFARHAWAEGAVDLLTWVTASSREAITASYAQAAAEILGADQADPERAAAAFLAWLEPKQPDRGSGGCRWMVVLDDLGDPADLRGLWPPASALGRTLVTTRRRDAALTGLGRKLVKVGLFTEREAIAYLTSALAVHDRHDSGEQITGLAGDLGYLPLALAQAAAYLVDAGLDCATYRQHLADRAGTLDDVLPDPSGLPDDQAVTVAAAWALSIERADLLRPLGLARPTLQLVAMLDPNGIPAAVLTSEPALAYLAQHRTTTADTGHPQAQSGKATAAEANRALLTLHRLSLIDHTPDSHQQTVRVHQLIQRATRDPLGAQHRDDLARTAADALTSAWPDIDRDITLAQALRANATTLIRHAGSTLYGHGVHPLLFRVGKSLAQSGQSGAAATHFERMETIAHRHLGPDHPDTLTTRHELADCRGDAGDSAGAAAAYEQLLADRIRVLGKDHPDTLTTRDYFAYWRGKVGESAWAMAAYEQLLVDRLRVQGEDHPDTLTTRGNLANWRGEMGDVVGAVAAYEQLLVDQIRVLGEDHPDALTTRHQVAYWRGEMGDVAGAVAAYKQLLVDHIRVLGKYHLVTLSTRGNLASMQGEMGDAAGAVAAYEELLPDRIRVLGEDHPDTLTTRHQVAYWRGEMGDAAGAIAAYEELLPDRIRVLGQDHPDILTTRGNLANWWGEMGDAAGAVAAYEELLVDQIRVLGEDHPDTLTTRHQVAYWRGEMGDAAGAMAAYEELLPDRIRVLGEDHPDTLTTRGNHANWRGETGDAAGAVAAYEELLTDQLRVLGQDHPDTLTTREELALWRGETGDAAGAVAAYGQLLAAQQRVLGEDHPDALTTRQDLAYWRWEAGDEAGALAVYEQLLEGTHMTFAGTSGVTVPVLPGWEDRSQTIVVRTRRAEEFAANIVVVREAVRGRSMEQFIGQHLNTLGKTFEALDIRRNERATLGAHSGHLIDYTFEANDKEYRQTQFFLTTDTSIITFTASHLSSQFPAFWPLAERIIEASRVEGESH
ncbi:tetratricopeptide repeat protein [Streptomyces sp. NPDC005407]|uniref:tetratricopeptide repeat protein n=1 Tax=Streptomyces sp. NPDC005407 TaxID=3155340 RepID=UPI0033B05429